MSRRRTRAFTLIELLLVLFILAAIAATAASLGTEVDQQSRYDLTRARRELVRTAILGDSGRVVDGQPVVSGFAADMGRLPANLRELIVQPGALAWQPYTTAELLADHDPLTPPRGAPQGAGWRGPYLRADVEHEEHAGVNTEFSTYRDGWKLSGGNTDPNFGWVFDPTPPGALSLHSLGADGAADLVAPSGTFSYDWDQPFAGTARQLVSNDDHRVKLGDLMVRIRNTSGTEWDLEEVAVLVLAPTVPVTNPTSVDWTSARQVSAALALAEDKLPDGELSLQRGPLRLTMSAGGGPLASVPWGRRSLVLVRSGDPPPARPYLLGPVLTVTLLPRTSLPDLVLELDTPPPPMIQPHLDELGSGLGPTTSGAEATPAPLPRRAPRILAIARDERRTLGAVLGWDGSGWRALASLEGPAGPVLLDDLQGLTAGLAPQLPPGERLPREALLLSRDVVSACVDVPGLAKLPAERVETIVGWELDPFVPGEPEVDGDADGAAPVACGWSRAAGPGPVLASGVRPRARDAARDAFARAGLKLRGLYPLLGCAAAELPAAERPTVVLELGRGAVFASRVEHGRVVRARQARCAPGGEVTAALGLVSTDAATVVAGPVEPALRADLEAEGWTELRAPGGLPVGLLGAARHALALPGGVRLAAVPASRSRRLRLPAPVAWALLGTALAALAVAVAEVQVGRALDTARQELTDAEERADAGRRAEGLRSSLASLRAVHALEREVDDRGRGLPAMIRDLAAVVPAALELRVAREEPTGLRLEGVSLDELSVSQFVAALAPRLKARGLVPGHPSVRPATGEPYYAFSVLFTRGGP